MRIGTYVLMSILAMTSFAFAQQDDLAKEIDGLRRQVGEALADHAKLAKDQEQIRDRLTEGAEPRMGALESRINAIANEASSLSATDVHSVANPVTLYGDFRTRLYYTSNRDFGNNQVTMPGSPDVVDGDDDDGTALRGCYLIGFTFNFDRHVTTNFSLLAHGGYSNGDTPGNNTFNSAPDFDKGVLGNQSGILDEIDLYEGWVQIDNVFGNENLHWKIGRQEIALGNEFVFGNNDFFAGETHDAAVMIYTPEDFNLYVFYVTHAITDSFSTRNHPYAFNGNGFDDDTMAGFYFDWKGSRSFAFDAYYVYWNANNGFSRGSLGNSLGAPQYGDLLLEASGLDITAHVFGARFYGVINGVADGLDYNLEVVYQTGDVINTDFEVAGLAIEAELGLLLDQDTQARIFTRFLYSEGGDSEDTGYIPLFVERHAYASEGGWTDYRARYGLMDIIPLENVFVIQGGGYFDAAPDWTIGATVLWATLDRSNGITGDQDIGLEIDLWVEHRYSANTVATFGFGVFFPEDAAPLANGTAVNNGDDKTAFLAYADIRVRF